MADISSTDPHGEISITDMKHLVTAVISFSSDQITTAFLNVDQLRLSLLKQIEKTQLLKDDSSPFIDKLGEAIGSETLPEKSVSDTLQTAFLRPDTPAADTNSKVTLDKEQEALAIRNEDDLGSVVSVKNRPLTPTQENIPSESTNNDYIPKSRDNPTQITKNTQPTIKDNTTTNGDDKKISENINSKQRKCAKLDELLKNHVTFTPYSKQASSKKRQDACTKQVTDVVQNTSSRKRKSAAPQYIPVSQQPQLLTPTKSSDDPTSLLGGSKHAQETHMMSQQDMWPDNDAGPFIDPTVLSERDNYPQIKSRSKAAQSVMHDTEMFNASATDLEAASTSGICGSDVSLCGPFITNSVPMHHNRNNGANILNTSAESTSTDPASLISIQPDQLSQSSHIDLSSVLDQAASGELPLADFASMTGLIGQPAAGGAVETAAGVSGVAGPWKKGRGRGRKNRAKNQNHHLIPSQLPFEENAESSNFEALDGQSKADIGKVKTPTSRGRVIPLRLRCRRCGERFTAKSDYQIHLQSQICSTGYTQTHTCQICGYCALTRQRLIVHLRTHSGERPHRCPFCPYAATQQAPLKRHIQNIHMKQGAVSLST